MSNKSSPRRRSANKRYDEDYEYYVPVRYYKGKNEANEETEVNESQDAKRKRGRPAGSKNKTTAAAELKQVSSLPKSGEEGCTENKPIELNILSIQQEASETKESSKKVNLGEVLELAVQSMSVTMAEEDGEEKNEVEHYQARNDSSVFTLRTPYESPDESDFEWKLDNEEDHTILSPPMKKKKMSANAIIPTNADDLEEFEEDGEGRIQVRTIVVGEGEGARIECLSCHRIMKPNSLKAHLKTHAHERPHACDLCDARFTRRGDLERHIKVVHNKDRPFKCSKCHRTFGDKKNLRWHLSNHDRKLFHHCQVCGFKFGKREYWENHVRYIHPIPGTDLEPIPSEISDAEKDEASVSNAIDNNYRKIDPVVINKMLNGNKGTPSLVYTNRASNRRPSADPFAGLKTPKIIHPVTYWDTWEEFMKRTMILRFRPTIQRYGSSGRPLRRKKVPETIVEMRPVDRPDSQFDLENLPADQPVLDDQNGVFLTSSGEVLYPEELCKADENQPAEEDEEEEEEEEVGINVGEMLDQPMNAGEVLSTHHIVYGEDGQMRLMVGPGTDAHHELEGGGYEEDDEEALLRGDLGHAFESGQIVILQPDGSAVLAPAGGQLVETENGQLILVQTLEDGTQVIHNAAVAYATAQAPEDEDEDGVGVGVVDGDDMTEVKVEPSSNQDAVQTLIDAVQELIDGRQKPS